VAAAQDEQEGVMRRFRLAIVVLYGVVSLWSVFVLMPVTWMLFAAFKTRREIFTDPLGLPDTLSFDSFGRAWTVGLGTFMLNSAIVTTVSVLLIVLVSGMAAYVLSRSESRWMQVIYLFIVAGFAVPVTAVLVPLYQMLSGAGLLNSRLGIALPYAAYGIPFTTILFYAFFLDFPRELEEAARLDGCGRVQIFFRIIIPLSGPAVASAAIFQAVFIWNEFLLALLMLTRPALKTLPVGILQLQGEFTSDWPAVMAGLAISTLPILVLFVLLQKYFVRSLAGLGK
jgi:multiple sugar transport system permease protein/raffinose/stachyose/melibiose transport system permease protein